MLIEINLSGLDSFFVKCLNDKLCSIIIEAFIVNNRSEILRELIDSKNVINRVLLIIEKYIYGIAIN